MSEDNELGFAPPESAEKIKVNEKTVPTEETSFALNEGEKDYFRNALRIGWHEKVGYVFGHKIKARTLTVDEELQVAEIVSPYQGSTAFSRIWTTVNVAAAVQEVNDEAIFIPITSEDSEKMVARKFERFKKYYPAFIDQIFVDILKEMENEIVEKLREKLGK